MTSTNDPAGRGIRAGIAELAGGLLDVRFRHRLTRNAMPALYLLALAFAALVPVLLAVIIFGHTTLGGLLFLVLAAPVLFLVLAAALRLALEFLLSTGELAGSIAHMAEVAGSLDGTLSSLSPPIQQLSTDLRNVQFWRFARRRETRE